MGTTTQVSSWRAIEALRAGVPNRDAVQALGMGTAQPNIDARFRQMLGELQRGLSTDETADGMVVAGDFGAGKSHCWNIYSMWPSKTTSFAAKWSSAKRSRFTTSPKCTTQRYSRSKCPTGPGHCSTSWLRPVLPLGG